MAKNERRTRTKRAIFVVIALLLVAYLISSTYARYSTVGEATGKVDIAEWHVVMTPDDGGAALTSTTRDITFTVQSNDNVVPNKIAPAVTAVATIELDLTGTEVAVDFTATVGEMTNNLPSGVTLPSRVTLTSAVDGGTPGTAQVIPLVNNSAFTATNGKRTVTLTLTWENSDTDAAKTEDTVVGVAGGTLTIPVTLTVQQHIGA